MSYYINQIDNQYNKYKYQYLDHMIGTIDLRQNYWDFNIQLIMINDCYLPLNTLLANLTIPYQQINNLTFNLAQDQSHAKDLVEHNKKYAKIYESSFNIDISNNEYLKQNLSNAKIMCNIDLEIDPQPIIEAKTEIQQEDLDGFINETSEQTWSWEMYYTNTFSINESMVLDKTYGYSLTKTHQGISKVRILQAIVNNYGDCSKPIIDLFTLQSVIPFKIEEAKLTISYWIGKEVEEKKLEMNLELEQMYVNIAQIKFDQNTKFDYSTNTILLDQSGVEGFFIPKQSHGHYQLELKVSQDYDMVNLVIKNNFNFNYEIPQPHIDVCTTIINSLDSYKKVEF